MAEMILLDTGPLVALLDRRDADHKWSDDQMGRLRGALWTCGAVLAETMFLLKSCPSATEHLRSLITKQLIRPADEDAALWARALTLMKRYKNVPMSFADACLVAISETHANSRIFTLDRDFLIYRRNERELLPLLAPFAS